MFSVCWSKLYLAKDQAAATKTKMTINYISGSRLWEGLVFAFSVNKS